MTYLFKYLGGIIAVLFVFIPHEFAHAFVAYKCGDPTAKMRGRLTLNPLKHIDPTGFVLCILTGFGWAKPVPIYPYNFHKYRKGLFLTAIAGVVANYIIAFIAYPLFLLIAVYAAPTASAAVYVVNFFEQVFYLIFAYSLSVAVFNLLPFYPLDGFRVVESLTREINPVRRFLKDYGRYILLILVLESFLCDILSTHTSLPYVHYFDILGYVHWFARNIIGFPITAMWNAIFGLPIQLMPF
ncbi:MAG: site-2 protease family protein [Clostridia bacterium]|jgi:Zn-dependent protease|nr:site-2 protease family protein [Clostridia bacterium]